MTRIPSLRSTIDGALESRGIQRLLESDCTQGYGAAAAGLANTAASAERTGCSRSAKRSVVEYAPSSRKICAPMRVVTLTTIGANRLTVATCPAGAQSTAITAWGFDSSPPWRTAAE